jgi:hypothetical protein
MWPRPRFALQIAGALALIGCVAVGCSSSTPPTRACAPLQGPEAPIVQRVALLADGRELLVFLPTAEANEDEARVFFGTPPLLVERRVTPQLQPSLFVQLTFDLDGRQATAAFSSPALAPFTSYLAVGADVFPLTELSADRLDTSIEFRCLVK